MTLSLISTSSLVFTSCGSDDSVIQNPNPTPPTPQPETKNLTITASAATAYLGETITLSATLDGAAVTSGVTYYVDDVAISGNTITSAVAADLLVSAKYQNVTSEYISVSFAVNPFIAIEGEGSFIHNGTTYEINAGFIELLGYRPDGNGGATIVWAQYGWSGNNPNTAENFVAVTFDTPATLVNEQITDYEYPDVDNNVYKSISFATLNGVDVISTEYTGGEGTVVYNSFNPEANPVTADFNIQITGTHNVSFVYSGDVSTTASAKAKMLNVKKFNTPIKKIKNSSDIKLALQK